jgi:uncharacterized protein YbcV (DUF1398 family)
MAIRPKVGGFPWLAQTLRRAGVTRNFWFLPACQSLYLTDEGPVVTQGKPLVTGTVDVPTFHREALISALRTDQAGESSFPEFLEATWRVGVVRYDVDFTARTVVYYGCNGKNTLKPIPLSKSIRKTCACNRTRYLNATRASLRLTFAPYAA